MQSFGYEFKGLVFGGMPCFWSNLIRLLFSFDLVFMIKKNSLKYPYFRPASMNLGQVFDLIILTFTACFPSGFGCKVRRVLGVKVYPVVDAMPCVLRSTMMKLDDKSMVKGRAYVLDHFLWYAHFVQ